MIKNCKFEVYLNKYLGEKNVSLVRKLIIFLSGNVATQGIAALSGILLARWLSVGDYGIYILVITIMGAITVLTKGGVHLGYSSILGRVWPNMYRVAEAIQSALAMRRIISMVILPFIMLGALIVLYKNNVSIAGVVVILIFLLFFWWADLRTRLIDQVLFFAKQTTKIQFLDMRLSLLRLFLIATVYFFNFLNVYVAVLISVIIATLRIKPIVKWVSDLLPIDASRIENKEDKAEIKQSVKRQLPVEIYYVFQVQIVFAVLTFYGSIEDIAGLGALGRINQLLLPVEAVTYAFLVPYFTQGTVERAKKIYMPLVITTMLPGVSLCLLAYFFPNLLLWIVGENYSHLQRELFVACLVATLARGAGTAWNLLAHRGWVKFSWVQIPVGLGLCVIAPYFLNLGTITGALLLQISFVVGLIVASILDFFGAKTKNG